MTMFPWLFPWKKCKSLATRQVQRGAVANAPCNNALQAARSWAGDIVKFRMIDVVKEDKAGERFIKHLWDPGGGGERPQRKSVENWQAQHASSLTTSLNVNASPAANEKCRKLVMIMMQGRQVATRLRFSHLRLSLTSEREDASHLAPSVTIIITSHHECGCEYL